MHSTHGVKGINIIIFMNWNSASTTVRFVLVIETAYDEKETYDFGCHSVVAWNKSEKCTFLWQIIYLFFAMPGHKTYTHILIQTFPPP